MDLKTWIQENQCIHKIRSYNCLSSVYVVEINQKNYFLKKIQNPNEYLIGKELETLGLLTFPKESKLLSSTISLSKILKGLDKKILIERSKKLYYYILIQEIKGETFLLSLSDLTKKELENILQIIFYSLECAWTKLKFVHLDLHLENIILQPIEYSVKIGNLVCEKYIPVIIDFDRSTTQKYPNPIHSNKTISNDIWKLLGILSLYLKNEKGEMILDYVENFIDRYEFQEKKEEFANQWFNVLPNSTL
jgi:hypothetical protein